MREFVRSGLDEQIVTPREPNRRDALDYACPRTPQTVRLIRQVASTGKVRVLMTNLPDSVRYPASLFGDLYHQRWRIEEAFKRIKPYCSEWRRRPCSRTRSCSVGTSFYARSARGFSSVTPINPTTTSCDNASIVTRARVTPGRNFRFNNIARQFSPS